MSSTDTSGGATAVRETGAVDFRLEVLVIPVADVDRAKEFYAETLGWRLDGDFATGPGFRVVQVTPPGSQASVIFGTGDTDTIPGSGESNVLVVEDLEAARSELMARDVDVSEVFHADTGVFIHAEDSGRIPGPDPDHRTYLSYASFRDPDGNGWLLQEITERLPGRVEAPDIGAVSELFLETSLHHDRFEKATPPHNWWDWYAAYYTARQEGNSPPAADTAADRYMKDVKGVVPR
jgi:catechol 2,3-dioxygenase-like lactoylglutathione lyase family enzyme